MTRTIYFQKTSTFWLLMEKSLRILCIILENQKMIYHWLPSIASATCIYFQNMKTCTSQENWSRYKQCIHNTVVFERLPLLLSVIKYISNLNILIFFVSVSSRLVFRKITPWISLRKRWRKTRFKQWFNAGQNRGIHYSTDPYAL